MSTRKSLLAKVWRKLFSAAAEKPAPVRLSAEQKGAPPRPSRVGERGIEPLEGRIAPATLLPGGKDLTYTDADGDHVTVHFSKSLFPTDPIQANAVLQNVFTFSTGKAHTGAANTTGDDVAQLLQSIDFSSLLVGSKNLATGVSITVTAKQGGSGDGFVNIGAIDAANITLGSVKVQGDLGQIDAGNNTNIHGLSSLTVKSLGKLTGTQAGTANYESKIVGALGKFTAESIDGGYLHVVNGFTVNGKPVAIGKIDFVNISSHIKARDVALVGTNDGVIQTDGNIGTLHIGSNAVNSDHPDLSDGITGGAGATSGAVIVGGKIGAATILGSVTGGAGASSATISAVKDIGSLVVTGAITGGSAQSATIHAGGKIGNVTVGGIGASGPIGGLVGGVGDGSAVISSDGTIGAVYISQIQGSAIDSGGLLATGKISSVTVGGNIQGGLKLHSGFIESETEIGNVRVDGDVIGGGGLRSGTIISAGKMGNVTVHGSIQGADGVASGGIFSGVSRAGNMGAVRVDDGILGGLSESSGVISSGGKIASVYITRAVAAGTLGDALVGGTGDSSGAVYALGAIGSVTVAGNITGADGDNSGSIGAHGLIGTVNVTGDLLGAVGTGSGSIAALDDTDSQIAGAFGSVTVGGNLVGAAGVGSGSINSDGAISSIKAGGLFGGSEPQSGRIVAGAGMLSDGNIGTVTVGKLGHAAVTGSSPVAAVNGGTVLAFGSIGSVIAGEIYNGTIHAGDSLGSLAVNGDMTGGIVTAEGQATFNGKTDVAIAKILVKGSVASSRILAGYSIAGAASNGHAQIGSVQVMGDWTASDLVAGVQTSASGNYGTASDTLIASDSSTVVSRIASILIGGNVAGSAETNDHFGFVANQIGSFQSAAGKLALSATPGEVFELASGTSDDVSVREVVPAPAAT